jgi:hypothetical protein
MLTRILETIRSIEENPNITSSIEPDLTIHVDPVIIFDEVGMNSVKRKTRDWLEKQAAVNKRHRGKGIFIRVKCGEWQESDIKRALESPDSEDNHQFLLVASPTSEFNRVAKVMGSLRCPVCRKVSLNLKSLITHQRKCKNSDSRPVAKVKTHVDHKRQKRICKSCASHVLGVFNVCKTHLRPPGVERFSWSPAEVGLKTIRTIPEVLRLYDISRVTKQDLSAGKCSRIPLSCLSCGYEWKKTIEGLINKGQGCPRCSKCEPWTLQRILMTAEQENLINKFDLEAVREIHITKGVYSRLPITCRDCDLTFSPTINDFFNSRRGCRRCSGKDPWTIERMQRAIKHLKLDTKFDFGMVFPKHMTGVKSQIPIRCLSCNFKWNPTIDNIFNAQSGCQRCGLKSPWTLDRLQKSITKGLSKMFDFSEVIELKNGSRSKIPLRCLTCNLRWSPTVRSIFICGYGCLSCSKRERWSFEKFLRQVELCKLDDRFDVTEVTPIHIQGAYSKLPLTCLNCSERSIVSINSLFNKSLVCRHCCTPLACGQEECKTCPPPCSICKIIDSIVIGRFKSPDGHMCRSCYIRSGNAPPNLRAKVSLEIYTFCELQRLAKGTPHEYLWSDSPTAWDCAVLPGLAYKPDNIWAFGKDDHLFSTRGAEKLNLGLIEHVIVMEVLEIGIEQHSKARSVPDAVREAEIRAVFEPHPVDFLYVVIAAYNHPTAHRDDQFFAKAVNSFEYHLVPSRKAAWTKRIKLVLQELENIFVKKWGVTVFIGN